MSGAEALKTVSSAKLKEYGSNSGKTRWRSRQKGAILIGLIVTMVVMASLGAGMVSLTTTSTFQELSLNNHMRAYYAAESGSRYAISVIREEYAKSAINLSAIDNKIFTMSNGDVFQITNLHANGANPETVTFTSTGLVGAGFLQAKRQLKYAVQPANQAGKGGGGGTSFVDTTFDPTKWSISKQRGDVYSGGPGGSWGDFKIAADGSLQVLTTQSASQARFLLGFGSYFYDIWNNNLPKTLSYDVQVKIKTYDTNNSQWLSNFMTGISFRLDASAGANATSFGASFKRGNGPPFNLPDATNPYIIFWRDRGGQNRELIAYKMLTSADGVISSTTAQTAILIDWSTILVRVNEETSPGRVNEIALFYGSPANNGSGGNEALIDANRLANARGQGSWPPPSPVNSLASTEDKFTLASGDSSVTYPWRWANNAAASSSAYTLSGCTYALVSGGSKEPSAIIRTSCLTTDTYTVNAEIGLHAFGNEVAGNVYFTDFGVRIPGSGGGADGGGGVIQSP